MTRRCAGWWPICARNWRRSRTAAATAARERHLARGKLLPRERVRLLLDPGVAVSRIVGACRLSACMTARCRRPASSPASAGSWAGNASSSPMTRRSRAAPISRSPSRSICARRRSPARTDLPCLYLVDSGGAYLPTQDEVFPDRDHFGRIFYNQATLSAAGMPQIALVMGSCTAGGAYVPAMADESIIVKGEGTIFLGGPPLVKAATGEVVSAEELGGAEVHSRDLRRRPIITRSTTRMRWDRAAHRRQSQPGEAGRARAAPAGRAALPGRGALRRRPAATRASPMTCARSIARLVDGSEFDEFKPLYGPTLVSGFARIWGYPVGIVANNGILFSESALKGAHFIELCAQRGIPLVFLQNITGFMVGRKYEAGGIAKDGAKMVTAVATARGAEIHRDHRRQLRRRQLRHVRPRLRAALLVDVAQCAHLGDGRRAGGHGAGAPCAATHARRAARRWSTAEEEEFKAPIRAQYETQGHPYYASARLWDDGVIDPAETRRVLALAISASLNAPIERGLAASGSRKSSGRFGVFRM